MRHLNMKDNVDPLAIIQNLSKGEIMEKCTTFFKHTLLSRIKAPLLIEAPP